MSTSSMYVLRYFPLLILSLMLSLSVYGQGYSGKPPRPTQMAKMQEYTVLDGESFKYRPGDVIALPSGKYKKLVIKNFKGTAKRPVTFINYKGPVIIENTERGGGAIDIVSCRYVRLTGSGPVKWPKNYELDPLSRHCGIRIACGKNGPHALNVVKQSSSIEIDHINVFGAGFAGFNVKDEPSTVTRDKFLMRNISLHHNYVHDTKGEGFYIGHTFYNGYDPKKTGKPKMPHVIHGLRVYSNITQRTGCEGIQIGSAEQDVEVFNNVIIKPGVDPFAKWQNNGIQIGAGTQARIFNNAIIDTPANGLILFGQGELLVYNNLIVNSGNNGIYCNTKGGKSYSFVNNTIVGFKDDGLRIGNFKSPAASMLIANNLIVTKGAQGKGIHHQNAKAKSMEDANLIFKDLSQVGFINPDEMDYRLSSKSPVRSKARTAKPLNVTEDFLNLKRGSKSTDVGAFIYDRKQDKEFQLLEFQTDREPSPWQQTDQ